MKPQKVKREVWEGDRAMSTLRAKENKTNTGDFLPWELENDLATVSCYAAGEVDNLILKRSNGLRALKRLREMIQSSLIDCGTSDSGHFMVDPTTAIAMNRALLDLPFGSGDKVNTVDELINESKQVAELLDRVADKAEKGNQDVGELKKLRSLCLALSKSALAFEEPIDEIKSGEF